MFKVTSRWPHQDSVKVEWNLGKRCNYDCSYCPASIHDNISPHTDIEILKSTVDKLVTLGKPIRLSFTGGEPTVHPNFEELVNYCKHVGVSWISVTTNGTRKPEWYANQRVDQYVFSIHFEHEFKRAIHTATGLKNTSKSLVVQLMAHHDYMTDVRDAAGYLDVIKVPYTVRRIRWTEGDHDLFDDMRYHPDDFKWLIEQEATVKTNTVVWLNDKHAQLHYHANDIIKNHQNKFKGWSCNAGIESLMINWDGDVHRATCRVGGSLGNIYTDTFTLPSEPIVCTREWCTCAADIPLTKLAPKESLSENPATSVS
jgi:MoaA/NifB/PqqE/SkfB family radical SAM enzyme